MKTSVQEIKEIIVRHKHKINIAIETGTQEGKTSAILAQLFRVVHTIELSEECHNFAKNAQSKYKNITFHLGDSAILLPQIAATINEPCFFYLDAHWHARPRAYMQAATDNKFPLWDELASIRNRPYPDILWSMMCMHSVEKTVGGPLSHHKRSKKQAAVGLWKPCV